MRLFTLHRLLIVVAILFCAGFAVRGLVLALIHAEERATSGLIAVAFAGITVALVRYFLWLRRTKSRVLGGQKRT